jgi:alpha-glucosidase
MQWSAEANAGFCPEGAEPWLPVADDYEEVNVAAQKADPRSMLSLTRCLLALRRELSALAEGGYEPISDGVPADCMAYLRRDGEGECLVALNFSGERRELLLTGRGKGRVEISTRLDREGTENLKSFGLRAHEGCVLDLRHQGAIGRRHP